MSSLQLQTYLNTYFSTSNLHIFFLFLYMHSIYFYMPFFFIVWFFCSVFPLPLPSMYSLIFIHLLRSFPVLAAALDKPPIVIPSFSPFTYSTLFSTYLNGLHHFIFSTRLIPWGLLFFILMKTTLIPCSRQFTSIFTYLTLRFFL